MSEEWRVYANGTYENEVYEVSNLGNVRKTNGNDEPLNIKPCVKNAKRKRKYLYFAVYCHSNRIPVYIHQAVAELFLPPKNNPTDVIDHIDNNSLNNIATNLRYVSKRINQLNCRPDGYIKNILRYNKDNWHSIHKIDGIKLFSPRFDTYEEAEDYHIAIQPYFAEVRQELILSELQN